MRIRTLSFVALAALLSGCPGEEAKSDAGTTPPGQDAASIKPDAQMPPDAAVSVKPDAAMPEDAATVVEPPDASEAPDAASTGRLPMGAVCTENFDCDSRCVSPFGAPANSYCSKPCVTDADCNLGKGYEWACLSTQAGKRCLKTCDSGDSSACKEGGCIENQVLIEGTHGLCLDLTGKLCDKQSDCEPGSTCTLATGGKDFFWYCVTKPWGTLTSGETCDPNLDFGAPCATTADCKGGLTCTKGECDGTAAQKCASFICFPEGKCAGPCATDADCPSDFLCSTYAFGADRNNDDPLDDIEGSVHACTYFPGSRKACVKDADCTGGEHCAIYFDDQQKAKFACRKQAGEAVGALCGDDSLTHDVREPTKPCASAMCGIAARCSTICATATDCPADNQCLEIYMGSGSETAKICVAGKTCTIDGDCGAGKICEYIPTKSSWERFCTDPVGTLAAGAACDPTLSTKAYFSCPNDLACTGANGAGWVCDASDHVCLPPAAQTCQGGVGSCDTFGFCSASCDTDAQCGDVAKWVCSSLPSNLNGNGTGDPADDTYGRLKLCSYLPGSRTACTKAADCTTAGETCRAYFKNDGTIANGCITKLAGGVAAGQPCSDTKLCETDMCDYNDGDKDWDTGTCAAPCAADADCPATMKCLDLEITGDGSVKFKACRKATAGGFGGSEE